MDKPLFSMRIEFIEIANFRKLMSVRIDLTDETTLFVGANNSGKTSAMQALRAFLLSDGPELEPHDVSLCHWRGVNAIGQRWVDASNEQPSTVPEDNDWGVLLPALDLWLHVEADEIHRVRRIIPTLDWSAGRIGVRLCLEPKEPGVLREDYVVERRRVLALAASAPGAPPLLPPVDLEDFLRTADHFRRYFAIRVYTLDPTAIDEPGPRSASPQALPDGSLALEGNPLAGLIRVREIPAQRPFGETPGKREEDEVQRTRAPLSAQLRRYYDRHLDPTKQPEEADLEALRAIGDAQTAFDKRLESGFTEAFRVVKEAFGFPGGTDPRPRVRTRLRPSDGLDHRSALTFELSSDGAKEGLPPMHVPEHQNGLGYRNLISMIFYLLSFRDEWQRLGKVSADPRSGVPEPLLLVLAEEPEAHLHVQVQQVFIRQAYGVLNGYRKGETNTSVNAQLVVSTHSSHVAHEIPYAALRYFRRLPCDDETPIPHACVVNLTNVFGDKADTTQQFVTRYLQARHSDLFFADAAILVEGAAERILLPHFIRRGFPRLSNCYVTTLEIGGSHAHKLRALIEHLGLLTLVITDLDALGINRKAAVPARGVGQVTTNQTLKKWVPGNESVDELLGFDASKKECTRGGDPLYAVRVAYQLPVPVGVADDGSNEHVNPSTFEDAFVLENIELVTGLDGTGLTKKFQDAIGGYQRNDYGSESLGVALFDALRKPGASKAEFALDVIGSSTLETMVPPTYIKEGLDWLEVRLLDRLAEILPSGAAAE